MLQEWGQVRVSKKAKGSQGGNPFLFNQDSNDQVKEDKLVRHNEDWQEKL